MTITDVLGVLTERKVRLSVVGDELVVRGEKRNLDPGVVSLLREHKDLLMDLVRSGDYVNPAADGSRTVSVPPNLIPPQCTAISPAMLPLVELTQDQIEDIVNRVPGGAANVQDIYPLAPLQEGFLVHHLMDAAGDPYLLTTLTAFGERARLDAYLSALQSVIDRHDILRTAIVWEGLPAPLQVVWRRAQLPVEKIVLDAPDGDVAGRLCARFDPSHYRIDVRQAPLLHAVIARDEIHDRWLLLLLLHHLAVDHSTAELIESEVGAFLSGRAGALPVPLPFRNFVVQARGGLSEQEHEAFFRGMLGDVDEPTAPFGLLEVRGRATGISHGRLALDDFLSVRLRKSARALGVSAASVFHLAWALVLARASGRDDVVFGTVLFGRMHGGEGADRVMGLFMNTLPVRIALDGSVEAAVRQTQIVLAELLRHEHASLALAQRCSGVSAPTPLFSAMLNYRHSAGAVQEASAEVIRAWEGIERLRIVDRSNYPLILAVDDFGEDFELIVQSSDSVDAARLCRLMETSLERLVEALEWTPDAPLHDIDVLPDSERKQLLEVWNDTRAPFASEDCIHELFEAQAAQTPEAIAISHDDGAVSYAELNARANRLAHFLVDLGVRPDDRVAICVERGVEMIVTMLGVWKAGAAYVPLDPAYPPQRIATMLEDCEPVLVLADRDLSVSAPTIDLGSPLWSSRPAVNLDRRARDLQPEHLAYAIYTSGSTGRPKGVLVQHRGLCNMVEAQIRELRVNPESRVLQFASFSFDACVSEVMMALGSGACLVLTEPGTLLAGDALADAIERGRITHVTLTPAVLAALPPDAELEPVQTLIVAGDALPQALAQRWSRGRRLINAYGPTEGTVCATMQEVGADEAGSPSIGAPIANTRIYVLDDAGRLVPIGGVGEICIGGVGVARGYWKRPELTADKFVGDPFSGEPGARMYRTGDLGRWRPDGTIEFLGRKDSQVKVRGFRIEPGEIEARLVEHAGVRDAIVVARESEAGDKRLVAYVVPRETRSIELWPSVAEFFVYDDLLYHAMTSDDRRNESYKVAIRRAVPGKVVVDIGTGKDAILARFCIEAGARRVYAIELLEETYDKARATVDRLGLADRIVVIHGDSRTVVLPEQADVCVSEIVGPIGGSEGASVLLNDARRFLREGGLMIPQRTMTRIAAVTLPDAFLAEPCFTEVSARYVDAIFAQRGYRFDLRLCLRGIERSDLLSTEGVLEDLDHRGPTAPEWLSEQELTITRDGRVDGMLVWLNLHTAEDEVIDILEHEYSWLPVYFPLFDPGVDVEAGDVIRMTVTARLCENGLNPDYHLDGRVVRRNGDVPFSFSSWHFKETYLQTPFYQSIFGNDGLRTQPAKRNRLSNDELRAHVQETLPESMVPSSFVQLDSLPLTPNGKVDRKALPAPTDAGGDAGAFEAPEGRLEQIVAEIWSCVLEVERVGRRDHFFDLGGESLLAVQVIWRLRQALGVEIAMNALFEHPVLADLAQKLAGITQTELPSIAAAGERDALSFAQQRLWFLSQMDGESAAYHIPFALRLRGALNRNALRQALDRLVARHEVLRTTFASVDGEPRALIADAADSRFRLVEQDVAEESELEGLAGEEWSAPFDLQHGPLIRGRLVRMGERDHALLITQHHIVSDGWSMGVLLHELSVLYGACCAGRPDPLPPPALQYADYAAWQRRTVDGEGLRKQAEYWKTTLAGAPALLELPADHPRPAQQDFAGSLVECTLDEELTRGLRALSQRHGTTLFMTLLASWAALLARLSGQAEVMIGTPVANRGRAEIEGVIGFFVNTLAMRVDVSGSASVGELLRRVKDQVLAAQQNQDIPFEQIVDLARPVRSLAHSPLFQAAFTWQNGQEGALELEGLTVEPAPLPSRVAAKYDLTLSLADVGEGITGCVEYATALFERSTIERYLDHWRTLVKAMVADELAIDRLPLLTGTERRRIVEQWNDTHTDFPATACIHELFEKQVEKTPDAVAVADDEGALTYGELNARANQLAHYLRELGVTPDARVAICAERGTAMVAGLLAVLKAGGAYVPLDPSYPADRLRYMLADSAPVALLTQGHLRDKWSDGIQLPVVLDLASPAPVWEHLPRTNPDRDAVGLTPGHLAYVIYTSGSTGTPKGVMVEHRGLCNLVVAQSRAVGIEPDSRILQFSSFSFDACIFEIVMALCQGASLHLPAPDVVLAGDALIDAVARHSVTHVTLPPSVLAALPEHADLKSVRTMVVAGEAVSGALVARWSGGRRFINAYGPTEATVWASFHVCGGEPGNPSIGRPIANARMYVLDPLGEPVPVGVAGEIHISGAGVARGYLNRPDLTAQKFVNDPFSGEPGARMYRTGDLGRYLPGGSIEFLGRNDFQVKVRGFRIEPGEIESRLAAHPAVLDAVVLAREERLVAYYVAAPDAAAGAEELRQSLRAALPEHMIPSAYVRLDAMPLTPNGKVDRKAFPSPDAAAYGNRVYEEPEGEAETAVANIFSALLGIERVGRRDNFFELGGHSLLAVTLMERMRREGLHADVRAVFLSPTVAGLAAAAGRDTRPVEVPPNAIPADCQRITPPMLPLVTLVQPEIDRIASGVAGGAANIQDIYPLAPLQEGILFHHLMARAGDPYLVSKLFRFATRDKLDAYVAALQAVMQRHDILRTAVVWEGLSTPVQVVWRNAPLPVEEIVLDAEAGDVAQQLYERFSPRRYRMDIRRAPLTRVCIAFDAAHGSWLLLLLSHHLVNDHSTGEVLQAEIEAHLSGRADALPPALPFRNFVAQARLGVSEQEHEAFFRRLLGDVQEPTAPFGLLEVQGDGSGIEEARLELDGNLARRIRERARVLGVSAASLCHLAWAQVLARVCGRDDVVFGTLLFGRMQGGEGADRVLGLFINTLPVRFDVGDEDVEASVRRMHVLLGDLLRHEHASLALAQRCSGVQAPLPLFSSLLNYRHNPGAGEVSDEVLSAWDGVESVRGEERTNYPLVLAIDDVAERFELTAQLQAGIGAMRVCLLMETALQQLVEALTHAPRKSLRALDVLPLSERALILDEWNATESDYPRNASVHSLFEAQARKTPAAVAVVFDEKKLTYGELNARANQLAHYLIALGVRPGDRVATFLERSPELVIAEIAILKCGAAYVPLDQNAPPDRHAFMIDDCQVRAVVTVTGLAVPDNADSRVNLDEDPWREYGTENPPLSPETTSDAVAYVMYTSGSTGQPKGVVIPHRGIARLVLNNGCTRFDEQDRIAWTANPAFDASTFEMWSALLHGAAVIVIAQPTLLDAEALARTLRDEKVTALQLVAGLLGAYAEPLGEVFPQLRYLVTGGDVVDPRAIERVLRNPPQHLIQTYGPTETTTFVTAWDVTSVPEGAKSIPIGRALSNTRLYILDEARRPVPVGVTGEIYIGGDGIAHGYWNRPELTAERFLDDPFSSAPRARMYKTGDLARWLPDGKIDFLGRNDAQVKIRGIRIEPAEIEARLAEHPEVREAVVLAHANDSGGKRLVAYVVWQSTEAMDEEPVYEELLFRAGLYRYIRQKLGRTPALLVSGLCFGAMHANWAGLLPLAVLGMLLALVYEATGSIRVAIIAHGLFNLNTIILLLSGLTQSNP